MLPSGPAEPRRASGSRREDARSAGTTSASKLVSTTGWLVWSRICRPQCEGTTTSPKWPPSRCGPSRALTGPGSPCWRRTAPNTVVTTADFVREVDDIQYGIGEGPCISAAAQGKTMLSTSLGGDARWPRFGGHVARPGVHSAVSMPLATAEGVLGAINVYAHAKNAFDERAAALGELFAVPAAIAVQNAQVLAQTRRLAAELQSALETRSVIERAVSISISRTGDTDGEALARLRTISQSEHRKLTAVAQHIVDGAARRARARRTGD